MLHALSDTSSISSIVSPREGFRLLFAQVLGIFKLPGGMYYRDAWITVLPPGGEIWKSPPTPFAKKIT